jgi:hypothetical protein
MERINSRLSSQEDRTTIPTSAVWVGSRAKILRRTERSLSSERTGMARKTREEELDDIIYALGSRGMVLMTVTEVMVEVAEGRMTKTEAFDKIVEAMYDWQARHQERKDD